MALIQSRPTKGGKPAFRVRIRVKGCAEVSATFARRTDAKLWAQKTEADIRAGKAFPAAAAKNHTVADLIDKYIDEILPTKPRNSRSQKPQLLWWKQELGPLKLARLTAANIGQKRNLLGAREYRPGHQTAPATVVRYLAILSHALSVAVKEWEWLDDSPMRKVRKPKEPRGRVRYLSKAEIKTLLGACGKSKNPHLRCIVLLAVSTGMRLGEIRNLKRRHIDIAKRKLVLTETKNDDIRAVSLAGPALEELKKRLSEDGNPDALLFPGRDANKPVEIAKAWQNALERAEITNFRFHDLRHCAASLFLDSGASIGQLAELLGHRSLQMVKRYAHLPESSSAKLVAEMNNQLFAEA